MKKELSIIIPIYNIERYLYRCIDSIVRQSNDNIEIILVDDGSTDNCEKICNTFRKKNKNIVYIKKKNEGLGLTRNRGLKSATGEYIWFVDGDDYIAKGSIDKLTNIITKTNHPDVISFDAKIVYGDKDDSKSVDKTRDNKKTIKLDSYPKVMVYDNEKSITEIIPHYIYTDKKITLSASTSIFKRSFLIENNLLFKSEREWINEDILFYVHLLKKVKSLAIIDEDYYYYSQHLSSLTTTYKENKLKLVIRFYKKIFDIIKQEKRYKECEKYAYNLFLSNFIGCLKLETSGISIIGKRKILQNIIDSCNNSFVTELINTYTADLLQWKIVIFLIKHKLYKILYYLLVSKRKIDYKKRRA